MACRTWQWALVVAAMSGCVDGPVKEADLDGDGISTAAGDCDDADADVFPGAIDFVGDDLDQNCDDLDGVDDDQDGHASVASGGPDCDDGDARVGPGADDEVGDFSDQNCDGVDGVDDDGDRFAGTATGGADCDDTDPERNPAAADPLGDGVDTNCDGVDGVDRDGDGVAGEGSGGLDCDDDDPRTYPGAEEACDEIDNDCNGEIDQDGVVSVRSSGESFDAVAAAVAAAAGGDTVLICPGAWTGQIVIDKDLTVAGVGGSTITSLDARRQGPAIHVHAGVVANISGLTVTGGVGHPLVAEPDLTAGGGLFADGAFTVELVDVQIIGASASRGGGIYANTQGGISLTSSSVVDSTATEAGGGIYVVSGPVQFREGELLRNTAPVGGALWVGPTDAITGGFVEIDGSALDENEADLGGAVYAGGSAVWVTHSSVSRNTAAGDGGAMACISGGIDLRCSLRANDTVLDDNSSGGFGGAIHQLGGELVLGDATFARNSGLIGGAVALAPGAADPEAPTLRVATLSMTDHLAETGGALYALGVDGELVAATFSGNGAELGGALYLASDPAAVGGAKASLFLLDNVYEDNEASTAGGAVHLIDADLTMVGGAFLRNTAPHSGAIHVVASADTASLTATSTVFTDNAASTHGGAVGLRGADGSFSGSSFEGNTAGNSGGAVAALPSTTDAPTWHPQSLTLDTVDLIANTATAGPGGAIFASAGTALCLACTLQDNVAGTHGGAIASVSAFAVDGSVAEATLNLFGSTVSGNAAAGDGGGIYIEGGGGTFQGSELSDNDAGGAGGGLLVEPFGTRPGLPLPAEVGLNVETTTFVGNRAAGSLGGGGAYMAGVRADIFSVEVTDNISDGPGGGLLLATYAHPDGQHLPPNISITGGGFARNSADSGSGGGIYQAGGNLSLLDTLVSDNHADDDGGGMFILDHLAPTGVHVPGTVQLTRTLLSGNDAQEGGGLALIRSSLVGGEVTLEDNTAIRGAGVKLVAGAYVASIQLNQGHLYRNVATLEGGGVLLQDAVPGTPGADATGLGVDWGAGADDNLPDDLHIHGVGSSSWAGSATIACGTEAAGCE